MPKRGISWLIDTMKKSARKAIRCAEIFHNSSIEKSANVAAGVARASALSRLQNWLARIPVSVRSKLPQFSNLFKNTPHKPLGAPGLPELAPRKPLGPPIAPVEKPLPRFELDKPVHAPEPIHPAHLQKPVPIPGEPIPATPGTPAAAKAPVSKPTHGTPLANAEHEAIASKYFKSFNRGRPLPNEAVSSLSASEIGDIHARMKEMMRWQSSIDRGIRFNQFFGTINGKVKDLLNNPLQTNTVRSAITTAVAIGTFYYMFSGKAPEGASKEASVVKDEVSKGVTVTEGSSTASTVITALNNCAQTLKQMTRAAALANMIFEKVAADNSSGFEALNSEIASVIALISNIKDTKINLDDPSSVQAYVNLLKGAEAPCNKLLDSLESAIGTVNAGFAVNKAQIVSVLQNTQQALVTFLAEVHEMRSAK